MKIGVVANTRKPNARKTVEAVQRAFDNCRARIVFEQETADMMNLPADEHFAENADIILSLGGDGTLLETLRRMDGHNAPVAGINIGTLGFLTTCQDEDLAKFASAVCSGEHAIVERTKLEVTIIDPDGSEQKFQAVNEVVIARGETGRMVELKASIDDELLNAYKADGLIVATPTGSTAYSLSAGGPLIGPRAGVFVLTPICPHSLSNRSLVVDDDAVVQIDTAPTGAEPILFTVDGRQGLLLNRDAHVRVRKAAQPLLLVRMPDHSFYETLRKKLHWH